MRFSPDSPARVVLAIDYPGWAFHQIASQVQRFMHAWEETPLVCDVVIADEMRHATCDVAVVFQWKSLSKVVGNNSCKRVILCLYDHVTWSASEHTERAFKFAVEQADAIAVANQDLADMLRFRRIGAGKPIFIVEDGVDRELFTVQPSPPRFVVGWCGNSGAGHRSIKGLDIIEKACDIARVELRTADLGGGKPIPHRQMPAWYAGVSCYVCASASEGTPNPPLEALACGRPVITTRVGIMPRVIVDGLNGVFVKERTPEVFAEAIKEVMEWDPTRTSYAARASIEPHVWGVKAYAWRTALLGTLAL